MRIRIRRREFLKAAGAGGLALWAPSLAGCGTTSSGPGPLPVRSFLDDAERATLTALAAAVVPEDDTVGAVGAGAVDYVDRLLASLDGPLPDLLRGGPFSGREPWPDPRTGEAGSEFPDDDFVEVVVPSRLQEIAARIELLGSDAVENGSINAPIVPTARGLRAIYRAGLADLDRLARERGAADLASLDEPARLAVFDASDGDFRLAVLNHLAEGLLCAPEYGGNRGGIAWRDFHWDGDSQPLGHTLFDPATGTVFDRPDRPNQSLDPALPNDGLEPDVERFVEATVLGLGGKRFF